MVGGADQAFPPAELNALTEAITGNKPAAVASRQIDGDAGKFRISFDASGNPIYETLLNRNLTPQDAVRVLAHEIGHGIDYFAGGVPQDEIVGQLRAIYNDLNNPTLAQRRATGQNADPRSNPTLRNFGPERHGYGPAKVPGELMAEAIRAYLTDPNYIKTMAPDVAKAIRAAVNANPRLSNIIQFNALLPFAAAPALSPGSNGPAAADPSVSLMLRTGAR